MFSGLGRRIMEKEKVEKLRNHNYEVGDAIKFLNLTPEEIGRITEMVSKARLERIVES